MPFSRPRILSLAAVALPLAVACGGDSRSDRAVDRVFEIEIIADRGGVQTVSRTRMTYDGSLLVSADHSQDGEFVGRHELTYEDGSVHQIFLTDADGDRVTTTWTYEYGKLIREQIDYAGQYTVDGSIVYHEDGLLREIEQRVSGGLTPTTWLRQYEYRDGLLDRVNDLRDEQEDSMEYRYDAGGRLEETVEFRSGVLGEVWEYRYDAKGRLDEAIDKLQNRYLITYDDGGRIARLSYRAATGDLTSIRYTYDSGSVTGLSISPRIPGNFDLRGRPFTDADLEALAFEPPGDLVVVPDPLP